GPALALGALALAAAAARISDDLTHTRARTCDGLLPMPASAYVLGWLGVGTALLAVAAMVFRLRSGSSGWALALLVIFVLVLLFTAFATYAVYADAPTRRFLCSG